MRCDQLGDVLSETAEGVVILDVDARRHVARCLRCQAEIVQYRKLLRALRSLRTQVLEPSPGLLGEVLATLEAAGERHAIRSLITGRRAAYIGGIAAATAAGVGSALVIASRSRRSRVRLAG